ncbi:unnamed protein product [Calypogeia fissa]
MYTFATSTSARVVDYRLDLTQLQLQYCIDANLSMVRNRHKKSQFSVANTEYEIVQERILLKTPILYVELSSAARIRWTTDIFTRNLECNLMVQNGEGEQLEVMELAMKTDTFSPVWSLTDNKTITNSQAGFIH